MKYEQLTHINKHTPEKISNDVLKWCISYKTSEGSVSRIMKTFDPKSPCHAALGMSIVKTAAAMEGVKTLLRFATFWKTTHVLY